MSYTFSRRLVDDYLRALQSGVCSEAEGTEILRQELRCPLQRYCEAREEAGPEDRVEIQPKDAGQGRLCPGVFCEPSARERTQDDCVARHGYGATYRTANSGVGVRPSRQREQARQRFEQSYVDDEVEPLETPRAGNDGEADENRTWPLCVNSTCLPGLVVAFSAANCSAIAASAPSRSTTTADQYWWPDKTTGHSRLSRFGMTSEPLTDGRGEALLTWWRAAFPARTSASPEAVPGSTASAADSGWKWPASFARYDRATSSWKTRQHSLLEDSDVYSETWPRWGLMRDGESSAQRTLVPSIGENGSGLLPTPTATDYKGGIQTPELLAKQMTHPRGVRLEEFLARRLLPTPTSGNNHSAGRLDEWGGANFFRGSDLGKLHLNPGFVEEIMAWPIGWTDLKPLATDRFQEWRQQHGDC